MRHHIQGYQLNRDSQSRRALFKNLITALVEHGSIRTTYSKAKAIQAQVDKLFTQAKSGQLHDRRLIDRVVNRRHTVNRFIHQLAPATGNRSSGFTRLVKIGTRQGDAALMARLELVDALPTPPPVAKKPRPIRPKKAAPTKVSLPLRPAIPVVKPQVVVKPGLIRQKSGER